MTRLFPLFLAAAVLSVSAQAASLPGDASGGKKLHDANCLSCHKDEVYKRKDRHVTSLESLTEQISGCSHQTGVNFSAVQRSDLAKYLNETYYKFK
jgi:cytochrome c2